MSAKKALIISVSEYSDDNLEDLPFCKNDGEEIYAQLKKLGYEIPPERKLIGQVNYPDMKKAIINFFRDESNNPQDTLLFYYSGHGVLDGYGGRFFCNSQINTKLPEEYGIPFDFLTEQMKKSNSEKKVAILDCCFSGDAVATVTGKSGNQGEKEAEQFGREALSKEFESSQGNCVLASSLSNRRSYQLPDKPFSAFTYFVLEGLKSNKESVDQHGHVTPDSLSEYIFSQLRKIKELKNQKPVRNISVAGKIILAEYPEHKSKSAKIIKYKGIDPEIVRKEKRRQRILLSSVIAGAAVSLGVIFSFGVDDGVESYSFVTQLGIDSSSFTNINPKDIAISPNGEIYVLEDIAVLRLDHDWNIINSWGVSGSGEGQFSAPISLDIDSQGNIYVLEQGNHRVQKFSSNGEFISMWGSKGNDDGNFMLPSTIAIDHLDNVYVADTENHRIQKFSPEGNFLAKIDGNLTNGFEFNYPGPIAINSNLEVFVIEENGSIIKRFSSNGEFIEELDLQSMAYGKIDFMDISIDKFDQIYATELLGDVYKISTDFKTISVLEIEGAHRTMFGHRIDISNTDFMYLVLGGNIIQKLTLDGEVLDKWKESKTGLGQFDFPLAVATNEFGNVYVSDYRNNRIQKFHLSESCQSVEIKSGVCFILEWGNRERKRGNLTFPMIL